MNDTSAVAAAAGVVPRPGLRSRSASSRDTGGPVQAAGVRTGCRRRGGRRMRRTAALVTAGALALLTGCQGSAHGGQPTATAAPAVVEVSPADGSADVS